MSFALISLGNKKVFLNHKYENALFSGAESYLMPPSLPLSEKGSAFTCISTLLLCLWTETATYCFTILLEICIVFCRCTLSNSHCLFLIFVCVVVRYLVIYRGL